jgi:hypothetical protein
MESRRESAARQDNDSLQAVSSLEFSQDIHLSPFSITNGYRRRRRNKASPIARDATITYTCQ